MKKGVILLLVSIFVLPSCIVTQKKFTSLNSSYTELEATNTRNKTTIDSLTKALAVEKDARMKLIQDTIRLYKSHAELYIKYRNNLTGGSADASKLLRQADDNKNLMNEYKRQLDALERDKRIKEMDVRDFRVLINNFLMTIPSEGMNMSAVDDHMVTITIEDMLLFEPGGNMLTKESEEPLANLADFFARNPDLNVIIACNVDSTDGEGDRQEKLEISVERATAIIQQLLLNSDVLPSKLTAAGRGDSMPLTLGENEEEKSKNRRTEIIISKTKI